MARQRKLAPEIEEQVAADYAAGNSAPVLARRYGVDMATILKTVRRMGGEVRTSGGSYESDIPCDQRQPHGAKHIPALDYRASRAERAAAQLKSYFNNEEGR
jgi:hypothetical protein